MYSKIIDNCAFSEKSNPDQLALMLFNEIEMTLDVLVEEPTISFV